MVIYVSLLIALLGLIAYIMCVNPKAQELGRIAFFCGLLACLLNVTKMVELLK